MEKVTLESQFEKLANENFTCSYDHNTKRWTVRVPWHDVEETNKLLIIALDRAIAAVNKYV